MDLSTIFGQTTTYSFKDLIGAFNHKLASFPLYGNIGMGTITITMSSDKTGTDICVDGSSFIYVIGGDNGTITIECQQTSVLHKNLLSLYNKLNIAKRANGDVSNWANGVMLIKNINDGTSHNISGISFTKPPNKVYATNGGSVTWVLNAGYIDNLTS